MKIFSLSLEDANKIFNVHEGNEMERDTKNGLEESTPDIPALIIEITVAIMHTNE
jgi:hypothetical protein